MLSKPFLPRNLTPCCPPVELKPLLPPCWRVLAGSPEVQAYQLHILGGIAGGACLVFVLWLVLALRQESKKRAGKHKKGKSGAAGTAGAAGVEQGAGEGLTEPLLARADGAGGADVEQGAVSQG